ncbi:UDP-glucose dehydrogenase family protein [Haloactinomyces albus]|uniref:UDP-glucose 6-dehydrogenase n=1 Tax=Haloactinomyces albus TaxID=1352928 RepID=A0AAE4CMX2_9ACTN|nr:UDP-glucose/GDP-mannose dehydrogenase family protein [Haloactinomyces albus]MDR7303880.1 UDPglucose 6-dehydrogenase [Haloactinomyces albus]
MDKIVAVVGAGYVGLTTAAGMAHLGHRVVCVDIDEQKIDRLRHNHVDLAEPNLPELVARYLRHGRLSFHTRLEHAVPAAATVFLCLPTPASPEDAVDMHAIDTVTHRLATLARPDSTIVVKSTVPPGTNRRLTDLLQRDDVTLVSNPEFLREGSSLHDFLNPQRIVIGAHCSAAAHHVAQLYATDAPVLTTDPISAEMIKYATNSYLAMKLAYSNTLAELCEHTGANITDVLTGIGHDSRIGASYLRPGPGWGGPCLPKDTRALLAIGNATGCDIPLLRAALEANAHHQRRVVKIVEHALHRQLAGCHIGVLGMTFKPGTNDLRDSPALPITTMLAARHAHVHAYDPGLSTPVAGLTDHLTLTTSAAEALAGCDLALLLTDWPEFASLPWNSLAARMRGNIVVDTRNQLDPTYLAEAGLHVRALGSPLPDLPAVRTA